MMDVRNDLGAIKVADHVVVGSEDRLTTVEMAREIAAEIPGAELDSDRRRRPLSNIEKPDEFNAAVLGFLKRHTGK